jgi:hypothetical protein
MRKCSSPVKCWPKTIRRRDDQSSRMDAPAVEDLITLLSTTGNPTANSGSEPSADTANASKYSGAIIAAKDFEQKAVTLEDQLIDLHNSGRSEDAFRKPVQHREDDHQEKKTKCDVLRQLRRRI